MSYSPRTQAFADALRDMIMSADEDVQHELRDAFEALDRRNVGFITHAVIGACREAFELIDEAKEEERAAAIARATRIAARLRG